MHVEKCIIWVVTILYFSYIVFSHIFQVVGKGTCASLGIKTPFSEFFSYASLCINSVGPFTILLVSGKKYVITLKLTMIHRLNDSPTTICIHETFPQDI